MYIPYGRQYIDQDDIEVVIDVLKSDYVTTGPNVEEFENAVAKRVGAKYAVAVSNGTAALHIACLAAGISEGDEVITTPITFAASANCVRYCKGIPVFADVDELTYNIDIEDIKRKITGKTKAIVPVHFTGQPCNMDEIRKVAEENNLIVIEDAAHAIGATYKGLHVGSISDMTTFSFHPVKHITTGEGGMVTTNSRELYEKLLLYRSHGITRNPSMFEKNEGDWYYEQIELGYNYRITDFQCALGKSQLKKLDMFIQRRREIAERYNEELKNCTCITIPYQEENCNSSWHLYVIRVEESKRKEIFDSLRSKGIGVNVHYIPVYKHPDYQKNGYSEVVCENAEKLYKSFISLPIYYGLTDAEQDYIIKTIKSLL